jgi:hypothetical protein
VDESERISEGSMIGFGENIRSKNTYQVNISSQIAENHVAEGDRKRVLEGERLEEILE